MLTDLGKGLLVVALALFFARPTHAEEIVSESFDSFDIHALPQGWSVAGADDLSVREEAGHGKVFQIDGKGSVSGLIISLDATKVAGRKLKCEVTVKSGNFTPVMEKHACPQLMIQYSLRGQGGTGRYSPVPPNLNDWRKMGVSMDIPAEATVIKVSLRVNNLTANVSFDNLNIQAIGDAAPAVGESPPGVSKGQPMPDAAKPALVPQGAAAQAPQKTLDVDGMIFGPEIAAWSQKMKRPGAKSSSIALVGPGLPVKELEGKLSQDWSNISMDKETSGPLALPEKLLSTLPAFLVKNKPELVLLVPELKADRKMRRNERSDWEDVARICVRFGAIPILAIPSTSTQPAVATLRAGEQEEAGRELLMAANTSHCAVFEMRSPIVTRIKQLLSLFDKHVFERIPLNNNANAIKDED